MRSNIDIESVYAAAVFVYGFEFNSRRRLREISDAKSMVALVSYINGSTHEAISSFFGWHSHTTSLHACRKMMDLIRLYPSFKDQFNAIEEELAFRKWAGILAD